MFQGAGLWRQRRLNEAEVDTSAHVSAMSLWNAPETSKTWKVGVSRESVWTPECVTSCHVTPYHATPTCIRASVNATIKTKKWIRFHTCKSGNVMRSGDVGWQTKTEKTNTGCDTQKPVHLYHCVAFYSDYTHMTELGWPFFRHRIPDQWAEEYLPHPKVYFTPFGSFTYMQCESKRNDSDSAEGLLGLLKHSEAS